MFNAYDIANGVLYVEADGKPRTKSKAKTPNELELENEIEIIDNRIAEKRKEHKKYRHAKKPNLWKEILYWSIATILILAFIPNLCVHIIEGGTNPLCDTPFGIMEMTKFAKITSALLLVPFYILLHGFAYFKEKKDNEKREGLEAEIEFLEKELSKQKRKLIALQQRKSKIKLKDTKRRNLTPDAIRYQLDLKSRAELINKLNALKDYIIKNYNKGQIKDALRRKGFTSRQTKESMEYIKKNFTMKQKSGVHH